MWSVSLSSQESQTHKEPTLAHDNVYVCWLKHKGKPPFFTLGDIQHAEKTLKLNLTKWSG